MRVEQIAERGRILTFDDSISLYLITSARSNLLCDTHLGPLSMNEVCEILSNGPERRRLLIFNSHSDWDHIWGNSVFRDQLIISHESCRHRMMERGVFDLIQNATKKRGDVVLTPPNLTFSDRLTLEDEGIVFSHSPGHTIDSSVCYDTVDMVLYLGDLVEDPIPYLDAYDLDQYIGTLTSLLEHPARILVSAHSGLVTRDLIRENIAYIRAFRDEVSMDPALFGSYGPVHRWNLNMRIVHQVARQAYGDDGVCYSVVDLLVQAGDLHEADPERIRYILIEYTTRC